MSFVVSAIAFIVLLTVLVIIHELGHFFVARMTGVDVEEFGFGLPPRIFTLYRHNKTDFTLNWIPFGGFVRLKGETSIDQSVRMQQGSFAAAPIRSRVVILTAGVVMNFLLAITLFFFGFWFMGWTPTYLDMASLRSAADRGDVVVEWGVYISEVIPGTSAFQAGVQTGTVLRFVDGQPVKTVQDVLLLQQGKRAVVYTLFSGEEYAQKNSVTVGVIGGKTGIAVSEYALNIQAGNRSIFRATRISVQEVWTTTVGTVRGMGRLLSSLLTERIIPKGITGIVGIAQLTHTSVQQGIYSYLRLCALLSLSLAVLNILPFPALDGGRMAFVLYEMVTGFPVNRRFEIIVNSVGVLLIMLLMAVVTWNDIVRIITSTTPSL